MRLRRCRRPDEPAAERLLDRSAPHPHDSADPLVRLLAAAAAPAAPRELAGEQAALAAFRAARTSPVVVPPIRPRRRVSVRMTAWLAGLVVTATAGVAVAAVGLGRPSPQPIPGVSASGATSGSAPGVPVRPPTPSEAAAPASPGDQGRRSPGGRPPVADPAALRGQCAAYRARQSQGAKPSREDTFGDLIAAAGGTAGVEAYCQQIAPTPTRAPSPRSDPPSASPRPGNPPTGRPSPRR